MANYANLLATIAANIYTNGNQEVTAARVKTAMNAAINSLGAGYQFMGVAHPSDTPSGYSDLRAFWLAGEAGTYTNFGGLVLNGGEVAVIKYDGNGWSKEVTGAASAEQVSEIGRKVIILDNTKVQYTTSPGYITSDGTINTPAIEQNEKTSSFIPIVVGSKFRFSISFENTRSMWCAYCLYDASEQSLGRVVPISSVSGQRADYDVTIDNPNAAYIRFTWRAYSDGKEGIFTGESNEWQNEVLEKFSKTNARIDNLVVSHINLLEGLSITSGYVYSHGSGSKDPVTSSSIYDSGIPVVAGETIYYKNLYPYFCGIKKTSDNTWVAMSNDTAWNASGEYVVPADGLLYISFNNSAPNHRLLTRDKTMYDDDIIESYEDINPEVLPDIEKKVYYVGSNREYTTLRAGINEAIKYKNSIVYVDPETFDLTQEFAAEISAQGTTQYGIKLENGVHIIFSPGAVVNALYQGTVQNVVRYFAPFFSGLNGGGFTLEGLTLYAKNTRYCVHDEMDGANVITRNRYINCKMVYDGSTSPFDYFQNCIGGGTAKHSYVEMVNCYFDTTGTMTDPSTVSYHNANVAGAKSTVIVSNCYFAHGTFRLGYYGPSTLMSRAFVNNCSFEVAPLIRAENQTAEIVNWEMVAFMNEIRS